MFLLSLALSLFDFPAFNHGQPLTLVAKLPGPQRERRSAKEPNLFPALPTTPNDPSTPFPPRPHRDFYLVPVQKTPASCTCPASSRPLPLTRDFRLRPPPPLQPLSIGHNVFAFLPSALLPVTAGGSRASASGDDVAESGGGRESIAGKEIGSSSPSPVNSDRFGKWGLALKRKGFVVSAAPTRNSGQTGKGNYRCGWVGLAHLL